MSDYDVKLPAPHPYEQEETDDGDSARDAFESILAADDQRQEQLYLDQMLSDWNAGIDPISNPFYVGEEGWQDIEGNDLTAKEEKMLAWKAAFPESYSVLEDIFGEDMERQTSRDSFQETYSETTGTELKENEYTEWLKDSDLSDDTKRTVWSALERGVEIERTDGVVDKESVLEQVFGDSWAELPEETLREVLYGLSADDGQPIQYPEGDPRNEDADVGEQPTEVGEEGDAPQDDPPEEEPPPQEDPPQDEPPPQEDPPEEDPPEEEPPYDDEPFPREGPPEDRSPFPFPPDDPPPDDPEEEAPEDEEDELPPDEDIDLPPAPDGGPPDEDDPPSDDPSEEETSEAPPEEGTPSDELPPDDEIDNGEPGDGESPGEEEGPADEEGPGEEEGPGDGEGPGEEPTNQEPPGEAPPENQPEAPPENQPEDEFPELPPPADAPPSGGENDDDEESIMSKIGDFFKDIFTEGIGGAAAQALGGSASISNIVDVAAAAAIDRKAQEYYVDALRDASDAELAFLESMIARQEVFRPFYNVGTGDKAPFTGYQINKLRQLVNRDPSFPEGRMIQPEVDILPLIEEAAAIETIDPTVNQINVAEMLLGLDTGDIPEAMRTDVNLIDPFNPEDPALRFLQDEGRRAIESAAAAEGRLNTGGTLQELQQQAIGTAAQYAGDLADIGRVQDATRLDADQQFYSQLLGSGREGLGREMDRLGAISDAQRFQDEQALQADIRRFESEADRVGEQFDMSRFANLDAMSRDQTLIDQLTGLVDLGRIGAEGLTGNTSTFSDLGSGIYSGMGDQAAYEGLKRGDRFSNIVGGLFGT